MPDWRDDIRQASFRGVEFSVDGSITSGGRRYQVVEYPGREDIDVDELGRRVETIQIRGFLSGPDWLRRGKDLERALRKGLPGELIDPWRGKMTANVSDLQITHRSKNGRQLEFSATFIEVGRNQRGFLTGAPRPHPVSQAREADQALVVAAADTFVEAFDDAPRGVDFAQEVADEVHDLIDHLGVNAIRGGIEQVARARRTAARVADSALDLINTPRQLAAEVGRALLDLDSAIGSKREALEIFLGIATRGPGSASPTPLRQAAINLSEQIAIGTTIRSATQVEWESLDEAEAAKARIGAALDQLQLTAAPAAYQALLQARVALSAGVPAPEEQLPRIERVRIDSTVPAIVLAHRLYGDRNRAEELVARNRGVIRHPGRIPSGSVVEVLRG